MCAGIIDPEHQRVLGPMDRQPEPGEPLEDLQGLRLAPVALVHVRLDPEASMSMPASSSPR